MSEWQPIETAPRDGTKVLFGRFVRNGPENGKMAVDFWATPKHKMGWIGVGSFNEKFWPVTHWMPLPQPPLDATDKKP